MINIIHYKTMRPPFQDQSSIHYRTIRCPVLPAKRPNHEQPDKHPHVPMSTTPPVTLTPSSMESNDAKITPPTPLQDHL